MEVKYNPKNIGVDEMIQVSSRVDGFNKFLYKAGIIRVDGLMLNTLSETYTAVCKFTLWNPLTWFYLLIMFLLSAPRIIYDHGLKECLLMGKKEITEGFSIEI